MMVAVETRVRVSVWQEDVDEHKERIEKLQVQGRAAWGKPENERTEMDELLMCIYPPPVEDARKCLEWEAHDRYGTHTRMQRRRSNDEWNNAGVSRNEANFYQDARLKLLVRFDETANQFVPMTMDEYAHEKEQSETMHINNAAIVNVGNWEGLIDKGPMLYKRGLAEDLISETQRKNAYRTTRRLITRAEEWGSDNAELVSDPVFAAYQASDGKSTIIVLLYDGKRFVDAWEATNAPWDTGKKSFYFSAENDATDTIAFRDCPPKLYAEHLGRAYKRPDGTEEASMYAWNDLVPNVFCEFSVDAKAFLAGLKMGAGVASKEVDRPNICAVAMELTNNLCTLISIDTYRLLVQNFPIASDNQREEMVEYDKLPLLPSEFCTFVVKAMKKPVGNLRVRIGKEDDGKYVIQFVGDVQKKGEIAPIQFTTRCVNGTMVNWRRVVPESNQCEVRVDAAAMKEGLTELKSFASEDAGRIVCEVMPDKFLLSAGNEDKHAVEVFHRGMSGDAVEVFAFHDKYLVDFMVDKYEPLVLHIDGPLRSIKLVSDGFIYVLMPMQVM